MGKREFEEWQGDHRAPNPQILILRTGTHTVRTRTDLYAITRVINNQYLYVKHGREIDAHTG